MYRTFSVIVCFFIICFFLGDAWFLCWVTFGLFDWYDLYLFALVFFVCMCLGDFWFVCLRGFWVVCLFVCSIDLAVRGILCNFSMYLNPG